MLYFTRDRKSLLTEFVHHAWQLDGVPHVDCLLCGVGGEDGDGVDHALVGRQEVVVRVLVAAAVRAVVRVVLVAVVGVVGDMGADRINRVACKK